MQELLDEQAIMQYLDPINQYPNYFEQAKERVVAIVAVVAVVAVVADKDTFEYQLKKHYFFEMEG